MSRKGLKTEADALNWEDIVQILSRASYELQMQQKPSKIKEWVRLQCYVGISSYCGLRASDILALKWDDVLNKETITLHEIKTGKSRRIDLNENLRSILSMSFELIPDRESDFIFTGKKGKEPISIQQLNRFLKQKIQYIYISSVDNLSTHTFRKSFGKRVYEINGKSENALILLSKIFNHSSIAITRRYIGIQQEQIRDIYLQL